MDKASQALFALKPVTFRYKKDIDQSQSLDYGLIAQDVAQSRSQPGNPQLKRANRECAIQRGERDVAQ